MNGQELEFLHTEAKAIIDDLDALRERAKRLESVGADVIFRALYRASGPGGHVMKGVRTVDESRASLLRLLDSARAEADIVRDVADDALDGSKSRLF